MATEDEINRLCESCGRSLEYDWDNEVWYCPYDCVPKYVIDTLNSINLEDQIDPDPMPPPETISEKQNVQEPLRRLSKSIYLENTTLLPDSKEGKSEHGVEDANIGSPKAAIISGKNDLDYSDKQSSAVDTQKLKDKVDQNPNTKKMKIDLHALIDEITKINELGDIDSDMAVVKARKIIETIITDLAERAGVKKPNLKETIDFLYYKRNLIPPEIFSLLSTIRVFGNLGSHFELGNNRKFSRKNVKLIGDMTANIVEWYITSEI